LTASCPREAAGLRHFGERDVDMFRGVEVYMFVRCILKDSVTNFERSRKNPERIAKQILLYNVVAIILRAASNTADVCELIDCACQAFFVEFISFSGKKRQTSRNE
jgi:hypothetical protein